jgi:curved DNA-binding protein
MQFKDYYSILGLDKTATADDIKKAYRKFARKYHPDVSKEPDAAQRIIEINEANAVLSDPEKRAAYDELGRQAPAQGEREFHPPPNWDAGFEFSDSVGGSGGGGQYSDFFEGLFGRSTPRSKAHGPRPAPAAARGSDHHAKIELDLLDAYVGAERTITLKSTRLDTQGQAVHEERHLQVKIPKGVREGQHIRLTGRGSPGTGDAPAGDLLLEVRFRPDPRWRTEGHDVYQRVPLTPWEATLGGSIQVHTPSGDTDVNVPTGWRTGRKLRLKGRGIPGSPPGDLYLELEVSLPPADNDAARAAYAEMAKAFASFNPRQRDGA